MSEEMILQSSEINCLVCGKKISSHTRSSKIVIYTEEGPKLGQSIDKRCSDPKCKSGYFLGYYTPRGSDRKIYTENAIKEPYIISTSETACATSILFDGVLSLKCGHTAFQAQCDKYNLKHEYAQSRSEDKMCREKLSDKCLIKGIWRFALLDLTRRYQIEISHYDSIDRTLIENLDKIHAHIEKTWVFHCCEKPGCGSILVCDGGMKPQRRICASRLSGIRRFKSTPGEVLTGCTKMPAHKQKFCSDCLNSVPSISTSILPKSIKKLLNVGVKGSEKVLNFEGLTGKRVFRQNTQFKVKFQGKEEEIWLNEKFIPEFLRQYFDSTGSTDVPNPKITSRKKIRDGEEIRLGWNVPDGEEYPISNEAANPESVYQKLESSCNTKKQKGTTLLRRTAGIFLGVIFEHFYLFSFYLFYF